MRHRYCGIARIFRWSWRVLRVFVCPILYILTLFFKSFWYLPHSPLKKALLLLIFNTPLPWYSLTPSPKTSIRCLFVYHVCPFSKTFCDSWDGDGGFGKIVIFSVCQFLKSSSFNYLAVFYPFATQFISVVFICQCLAFCVQEKMDIHCFLQLSNIQRLPPLPHQVFQGIHASAYEVESCRVFKGM